MPNYRRPTKVTPPPTNTTFRQEVMRDMQYPARVQDLNPEGVVHQLLNHANLTKLQLSLLQNTVTATNATQEQWARRRQLIAGGMLIGVGVLLQALLVPTPSGQITLFQALINLLAISLTMPIWMSTWIMTAVQTSLIAVGIGITTATILAQRSADAWKLSHEISKRL